MSKQAAKITLFWLNRSRAQRTMWLLEELKLDYEIKTFKRESNQLAPPELKKIHPLGKAPVISVETSANTKPLVLAESGFISEYLIDSFGPHLRPQRYPEGKDGQLGAETEGWLRYRYYNHYIEGSLMPLLVTYIITGGIRKAPVPFFIKPVTKGIANKIESSYLNPNIKTHFEFLEEQLKTSPDGGEFLCGKELSGADIDMSFPLLAAKSSLSVGLEDYPRLKAYADKLEQQDGYKKSIQKVIEIEGSWDGVI